MDLFELLLLACRVSLEGGKEIMEVYKTDFDVNFKNDKSPLTIADQNAHDVINKGLTIVKYPIMSEEGKESSYEVRKNWTRYWCVDPLDGTREFVKRNGEFTVNIALIDNNSPILGVIYVPVLDILYAGSVENFFMVSDALNNFQKRNFNIRDFAVPISNKADHTEALKVLVSRSHLSAETKKYLDELSLEHSGMEFLSAGSALKFGLMAEGKADLYPRFSPCMEWDTAAGHAILKAVGKNIYSYPSGEELSYNKINLVNDWFIAR